MELVPISGLTLEDNAPPNRRRLPHTFKANPLKVLMIDLSWTKTYFDLYCSIKKASHVTTATTAAEAIANIRLNKPDVIVVTNTTLLRQLTLALASYVKADGGTVILSGKMHPRDVGFFLTNGLGLKWRLTKGDPKAALYGLNADAMLGQRWQFDGLPEEFRMRVRTVTGTHRHEAVYVSNDSDEVPIAWGQVGYGHVGYVGDLEADEDNETMWVVLRMVGFVPPPPPGTLPS
ncbi:hypothetical protein EDC01DRAFT_669109 [Geopyxis carbonaria]|nr:hypothetical protein EDC01DRAFT_669109 [Geopyxis carbonaria]